VIADDMQERGVTSVGVIYSDGSYGKGLAESFQTHFEGEVMMRPFSSDSTRDDAIYDLGTHDMVEEVLFISPEVGDTAALVNTAHITTGFENKGLFLTDGAAQQLLLDLTLSSTAIYPKIRGTRPATPTGTLWGYFATSYLNHYGSDPKNDAYSAYSHDAGWLSLYAAAAAKFADGRVTGKGMSRAMRHMSEGSLIPLNRSEWPTGLDALMAGQPINVEGSSGALDYDPTTEETFAPIEVWNIIATDGQWSLNTVRVVKE
jgi:branched-chain amino acid transport system substrate-binding protein